MLAQLRNRTLELEATLHGITGEGEFYAQEAATKAAEAAAKAAEEGTSAGAGPALADEDDGLEQSADYTNVDTSRGKAKGMMPLGLVWRRQVRRRAATQLCNSLV